ncbi:MAG: methyltransferase domain-containing protein [Chryseotalea sp. WA131a]|nr:MAG: methyltransferase domain-containing protein [Chryseotalea sp. WA131a]
MIVKLTKTLFFYFLKYTKLSRLQWHDLRDVKPVSRSFGIERGKPIDRFYIEKFLGANKHLIKGKVLEVGETRYIKQFGTGVESADVLHVEKRMNATLVADLTKLDTLPQNKFDCFIATQVLNFIFDFQKAIEGSYYLLRPGGVMLATVACISRISPYDVVRWGHFWGFYPQGIERAFKNVFGEANVTVQVYGNSLSAICFIKGIAVEELKVEELDYLDADYPVSISIIARKPSV